MSVKVNDPINALPTFVVAFDLRPIVACSDPEFAEQRQQWINKVYSLQAQLQKEIERITGDTIQSLDAQHEEVVLKCKEIKSKFDEVNSQASYFQASERSLSKDVTAANFAVKLKKDSPLQPAYATKSDIAQWQSELDELQAAENDAIKKYYSHQSLMAMWQADRDRLANAHNELIREEAQIRHRLERLTGEVTGPQPTAIGLSA